MKKIERIFERELNACFQTLYGYVFTAFLLLVGGIYTSVICVRGGSASFEMVLSSMTFIYLIAIPILTMRSFAEERRQKTEQLLYALPVSMWQVVLGKFLALAGTIAVPILIMALYPVILSQFGNVDYLAAYCALLGFFFLGASLAAVGLFLSAQADSQPVAAGLCFFAMLLLFFLSTLADLVSSSAFTSFAAAAALVILFGLLVYSLTRNIRAGVIAAAALEAGLGICFWLSPEAFAGTLPAVLRNISVFDRYYIFLSGIFDWTAIVYLLSVTVLFLVLTVLSMEKRRWN